MSLAFRPKIWQNYLSRYESDLVKVICQAWFSWMGRCAVGVSWASTGQPRGVSSVLGFLCMYVCRLHDNANHHVLQCSCSLPFQCELYHYSNMPIDISKISGNASPEIKRVVGNPVFLRRPPSPVPAFGEIISQRIQITEISIDKKQEEPRKIEARVVCELTVEDDMVNGGGKIHGGCSAFLVDL